MEGMRLNPWQTMALNNAYLRNFLHLEIFLPCFGHLVEELNLIFD